MIATHPAQVIVTNDDGTATAETITLYTVETAEDLAELLNAVVPPESQA